MREYRVGQLAEVMAISVRTLHHYDRIGLLKPSSRTAAGYRYYTEADRRRLHDILFYRALGFALEHIDQLLNQQPADQQQLLQQQLAQLDTHIDRLQKMRQHLILMTRENEANEMNTKDTSQNPLNGFDPDEWQREAQARWQHTDAWKISQARTQHYSKADIKRNQALNAEQLGILAGLMQQGVAPESTAAVAVAEQLRRLIDEWYYPCSKDMHRELGQMYLQDERFKAFYEQICPGLSVYLVAAIEANARSESAE